MHRQALPARRCHAHASRRTGTFRAAHGPSGAILRAPGGAGPPRGRARIALWTRLGCKARARVTRRATRDWVAHLARAFGAPEAHGKLQLGLEGQRARAFLNDAQPHAVEAKERPLDHNLGLVGDIEGEDASLVAVCLRVRHAFHLLDGALQVQGAREPRDTLNDDGRVNRRVRVNPFLRRNRLIRRRVVNRGALGVCLVGVVGLSLRFRFVACFGLARLSVGGGFRFGLGPACSLGGRDELGLGISGRLCLSRGIRLTSCLRFRSSLRGANRLRLTGGLCLGSGLGGANGARRSISSRLSRVMKVLARRSSSEWKLMTTRRP